MLTVQTIDGEVPADLVVLGLGVTPNSDLAADAGVALGARGAIAVDRRQQTNVEGVWAAGDCAESFTSSPVPPSTSRSGRWPTARSVSWA